MLRSELPERLKMYRKRTGMIASEVGEKLGISGKTVNAWENGRGQPDADMLLKLCEVYGISSISELLGDPLPSPRIAAEEMRLLSIFRELSDQGKEYLIQTAEMAALRYKKDPAD